MEEIKLLAQFGIGGVLGGIIFWFYRQDRNASEARYTTLALGFKEIVTANTAAMIELKGAITRK